MQMDIKSVLATIIIISKIISFVYQFALKKASMEYVPLQTHVAASKGMNVIKRINTNVFRFALRDAIMAIVKGQVPVIATKDSGMMPESRVIVNQFVQKNATMEDVPLQTQADVHA